jgi:hypothetical protein
MDGETTVKNTLVTKNTIRNLYTAESPVTDDYTKYNRAYGILVYGTENIEISYNHVENIIGGEAHSGIYTKSPEARILYNEVINAGDGGGCIVNRQTKQRFLNQGQTDLCRSARQVRFFKAYCFVGKKRIDRQQRDFPSDRRYGHANL